MTTRRSVSDADLKVVEDSVSDFFAELVAEVRVPDPLPLTKDIVLECPTKTQVSDLLKAVTEDEAQKIIFGKDYDKAMKLFNDKPVQVWNKFMEKYNEHFFGDGKAGK
ncbi:tail assembly chaperone [Mycobacterium phage Aegeus]|nr:tail assembly chaperone [Mycobacterium phage Baudelaire]WKW86506.1 tail assembly chaperone [Mycobacterium phage Aegeus]